jgi:hypothetical protein
MLAKRPEIERRLEAAREELTAAEAAAAAISATEAESIITSEAHFAWRAKRDTANGEVERLGKLIRAIELEAESALLAKAEAKLRGRHADKLKMNSDLADRIRRDLAKANAILLSLLRDVAVSAAEDQMINATIPDDLEPLMTAEFLARGRSALPRKEIGRERVWLWTRVHGGHLIGDQDAVEDRGGGEGMLKSGLSTFPCVKALFEQVTYHPAEPMERIQPVWHMKIPHSDGPGFAFDGSRFADPRAALAALDYAARAKATTERPIEIELTAVPTVAAR